MALTHWRGCPAHLLPGRLRVRLPGLQRSPLYARGLEAAMRRLPGVRQTVANPDTGNLLVIYNPATITLAQIAEQIGLAEPAAAILPSIREATIQTILTGAALTAVAIKRVVLGPSALSHAWGTYDLAGIVTVAASYPFFRRGLTSLRGGRLNGDLLIGAAALATALLRENVLGLAVLWFTNLNHLILARTMEECRTAVDHHLPKERAPRHDRLLAERFGQSADRWGLYAVGAALLTGLVTRNWRRALATLIAAAPAASALSARLPLATATAAAARSGILTRGAEAVAAAGQVDRVLFDSVEAPVSREEKANLIASLQAKGHTVAVVSDNINDAPELVRADLSIALSRGKANPAIRAADVVIKGGDPRKASEFIRSGRRVIRVAHQNQALASSLNATGLLLAATGIISPLGASLWHNMTSLAVVLNSSRLLPR
jgi:cation transport ATPase